MREATRDIKAAADQVFAVLADGWSYAAWVVGAAHTRDVDPEWPQAGALLHHRVGPWPFSLDDTTQVVAMTPDRMLKLDARMWPLGAARIQITLEPLAADRTRVRIAEKLTSPLASRIPAMLQEAILVPRNQQSLARLGDIAEHRVAGKRG